jgi:hypothetical protein
MKHPFEHGCSAAWRLLLSLVACSVASACQTRWPKGAIRSDPTLCCGGRGSCIAVNYTDPRYGHMLSRAECPSASVCVPDELQGARELAVCKVQSTGAEGRCLPDCLSKVQEQGERLARDGCRKHERCAPCYDPITGETTGACAFGDDTGPTRAPVVFADCCEGLGRCVPGELLSPQQQDGLGRDSCSGENALCVPRQAVPLHASYVPASCTSSLLPQAEGRCLPACLPGLAGPSARYLAQDECLSHELCAPCYDPLTGELTKSCTLGDDPGPTVPAARFADCCGGLGRCLPDRFISDHDRAHLGPDSCEASADLCVPANFAEHSDFVAPSCMSSLLSAEGRCLPACLPELARKAEHLARDGCAAGELCAPCFDPVTGEATGSCSLGGDPGPEQPPATFAGCCSGLGKCVPATRASEHDRARLGRDRCAGDDELCAPTRFLDADFVAERCDVAPFDAEGRCLPACLPELVAQADKLKQGSCPTDHVCAPCTDPFTGKATGSCEIGADPGPSRPPFVLKDCCVTSDNTALGVCLSLQLAPPAAASFPSDSCQGTNVVCAPRSLVQNPNLPLTACTSPITDHGVCLGECLLPSMIPRGTCGALEACAPCAALGSDIKGC